jgi:putative SOS response-associated peptidase YedK
MRRLVKNLCGRYQFTAEQCEEIQQIVHAVEQRCGAGKWKPGEIFPTDPAPALRLEDGGIRPDLFVWGFPLKGRAIINARAETAADKPLFQDGIRQRRCIIPSTGFYEWDAEKQKYLFRLPGEQALYMAGIYEERDGQAYTCILTTAANASMREIHDRMPLVLTREQRDAWLRDSGAAERILHGTPPELDKTPMGTQLKLW